MQKSSKFIVTILGVTSCNGRQFLQTLPHTFIALSKADAIAQAETKISLLNQASDTVSYSLLEIVSE